MNQTKCNTPATYFLHKEGDRVRVFCGLDGELTIGCGGDLFSLDGFLSLVSLWEDVDRNNAFQTICSVKRDWLSGGKSPW